MGKFINKKPKLGFSMPSVDITRHNKAWRTVLISELALDDVIADKGKVNMLFEACDGTWYLEAGTTTEGFFPASQEFYAFTRKVD